MTPNLPTPEGRALGSQLARFYDAELAKRPGAKDGRCGSCAFRPGTDPNGSPTTTMDALKCLMEQVTFACHETVDLDGEPTGPCRGWAVLATAGPKGNERREMPWLFSDEIEDPTS